MKHPAYHLRTNKAVDRFSLIDQISALVFDEKRGTFYSLSGPFLEDMKLAHSAFPRMRLVTIESNVQTHKRQKFHKFTSKLTLINSTLDNFLIHDYRAGFQDFFWLDFTNLSLVCFQNFQSVLSQVAHGSVIRITVRAQPDTTLRNLGDHVTEEQKSEIKRRIEEDFIQTFGSLLSYEGARSPICNAVEFAKMIQLMVRRAASQTLDRGEDRDFFHIASTRYEDGVQMLSVTGVVLDRSKFSTMKKKLKLKNLNIEADNWSEPISIEVPSLSVLERITLDRQLPKKDNATIGKLLLSKLKYNIDEGERRSKEALRQYALHYRNYPNFIKADL